MTGDDVPTETNLSVRAHLYLEFANRLLSEVQDHDSMSQESNLILKYVEQCFEQVFEEIKNWKEE